MEGLHKKLAGKKNFSETKHFKQLNGLEVLRGTFTTNFFKPHFHETYSVIIINNGVGDYSYKNKEYIVPSGELLLLNPFDIHTGKSIGKDLWSFRSLYLPKHYVMKCLGWEEAKNLEAGIIKDSTFMEQAIKIHESLLSSKDFLMLESLLTSFIIELFNKYGTEKEATEGKLGNDRLNAIRDYLHDNYRKEVSLDDLSIAFNISRFHLIKSFCQRFGLPPHKYLINLRVEKSKGLLQNNLPVTQVAYETGFYDQSHFINSFKRLVGTTPKRYASSV